MSRCTASLAVLCLWPLLVEPALAETTKMRPATQAQITRHLKLSSKLSDAKSNGFSYKRGDPRGYKVSHGEICVLFPDRRIDCALIATDGSNFRMTLRDGSRHPL